MNVRAVKTALDYGRCKEVWLPSLDAAHQKEAMGLSGGIRVSDCKGTLTQEMMDVLDIMAEYNDNAHGERVVLSACHVSNEENELVMNGGVNPVTGDKLINSEIDFETAAYEEIEWEYSRMMHHIIAREEEYWNAIMLVHNNLGLVHPIMSVLLDDCLEKGKHAYEGGCRYNDPASGSGVWLASFPDLPDFYDFNDWFLCGEPGGRADYAENLAQGKYLNCGGCDWYWLYCLFVYFVASLDLYFLRRGLRICGGYRGEYDIEYNAEMVCRPAGRGFRCPADGVWLWKHGAQSVCYHAVKYYWMEKNVFCSGDYLFCTFSYRGNDY